MALKQWNVEEPKRQIALRKANNKGDLTFDELELELKARDMTFTY